MMRCLRVALLVSAVFASAPGAVAQGTPGTDTADAAGLAFCELVRQGTARFADKNAAIRAGYRPVGGDFPAMGRHWVHPGIILRGEIEPENPAILSYAEMGGAPVLVGVAFAISLAPGQEPPPIAGQAREWHEHNGSVAEESLIKEHDHGSGEVRTRLAILHVWSGIQNPDGTFATDNWALPFVRAGLAVPDRVRPAAARAVALLSGGADYYAMLIGSGHGRTAEVLRLMDIARQEATAAVTGGGSRNALTPIQTSRLEEVWTRLVISLEAVAGESVRPLRIAAARSP